MNWSRNLINLRDVLAGLYITVQDSRRLVEDVGLNPSFIEFHNKAINNWQEILREAQRRNKVGAIIDAASREYPENEWLSLAREGKLNALKGPDIEDDLTWQGPQDTDRLEKIIGDQSTLLPISFLQIGLDRARSVARVVLGDGSTGSGFLTDDNLLITNHHVLATKDEARDARVQFNYQQSPRGLFLTVDSFELAPHDGFETSENDDWTAVRVAGNPSDKWGRLALQEVDPKVEDRVNIIQHPGGGAKQIALYHNIVAYVGQNRLQYLTDTLPGSSGSPVFDNQWRVVALHHSGGWLIEPGTKRSYLRNEGIHINVIVDGLLAAGLKGD